MKIPNNSTTIIPIREATQPLTPLQLREQNRQYVGTGGISQENRSKGFAPAFMSYRTGTVYLSCFADGRPAPFHTLEGLPDKDESVEAGFVKDGKFYTRAEAAAAVQENR